MALSKTSMTVPLLLGEDFQQAYELSVTRSLEEGTKISFANYPYVITAEGEQRNREFEEVERAYVGETAPKNYLKGAYRQALKRRRNRRKQRLDEEEGIIRAKERIRIKPESVAQVEVSGPFDTPGEWVVEKELIASTSERPFIVPNTLISSRRPVIPVANTSTVPRFIQKGEALGRVHRADEFFDKPRTRDEYERFGQHAAFLSAMIDVNSSGKTKPNVQARAQTGKRAQERFRMPESTNYDAWWEGKRSFPMPDAETYAAWKDSFKEEQELAGDSEEAEQVGPKTAEMPETQDVSSRDFLKELDVGQLPAHLRERALKMLERRQGAFALDGRLGNHPAMAKIRTKEGVEPIALPMRGSSPAKKAVMDEQIDKWFEQDVIEPSRSPWSAPVVIAYRNGKPRFCVDYLRALRIARVGSPAAR